MNKKVHCFDHQEHGQVFRNAVTLLADIRRFSNWAFIRILTGGLSTYHRLSCANSFVCKSKCNNKACTRIESEMFGTFFVKGGYQGAFRCHPRKENLCPLKDVKLAFSRSRTFLWRSVADLQFLLQKLEIDLCPLGRLKYTMFSCG